MSAFVSGVLAPPPSMAAKPGGKPPSIPSPGGPSPLGGGIPPIICCRSFIIGSSCCSLSLPGWDAPLLSRARISASVGTVLFGPALGSVLGVRAAEGWVERSTSSGSAWDTEGKKGAATGGGSCIYCQLVVHGRDHRRVYQERVLDQRHW